MHSMMQQHTQDYTATWLMHAQTCTSKCRYIQEVTHTAQGYATQYTDSCKHGALKTNESNQSSSHHHYRSLIRKQIPQQTPWSSTCVSRRAPPQHCPAAPSCSLAGLLSLETGPSNKVGKAGAYTKHNLLTLHLRKRYIPPPVRNLSQLTGVSSVTFHMVDHAVSITSSHTYNSIYNTKYQH